MKSRSCLLAFAVASLFATAAMAQQTAQMPPVPPPVQPAPGAMPAPPPPPPPAPMPPMDSQAPMAQSDMGNQQSSQYTSPNGTQVTVNSGMPAPADYGPRPSFSQLDVNHDGRVTHEEAKAYLLLYNDWINVAHHRNYITRAQYDRWNRGG